MTTPTNRGAAYPPRVMRLRLSALSALVLCTLAACSPSARPPRTSTSPTIATGVAVVTGGISPCRAIPFPNGPRYAAGTVTVLRGQITWTSIGGGDSQPILPTDVADRAEVGVNGTYRFVLAPGHYVLVATFAPPSNGPPVSRVLVNGVAQPASTPEPFVEVTARAGSTVEAGIPNVCI